MIAGTVAQSTPSPNSALRVANSGGNATSPLQYGLMFEDINHSGDGGIYAELIRNRAFQGSDIFPSDLSGWHASTGVNLSIDTTNSLSAALSTSAKVTAEGNEWVSLVNEGWWGIEVKPQTYTGSFYVRGAYEGQFVASLQSTTLGNTLAVTNITSRSLADAWTQHNFTLKPTITASNIQNTFSISYDGTSATGPLNFNLISLFPPTYNNRPNGLRVDLMELLKGMAPSFLRFPGGNNLEGSDPPYRWIWNQTIGPLVDRPGRPGTWGYENTDGLGLIEYLWWCQDLGMEPILDIWAGFYLGGAVVSEADLGRYVQDVLNELEFIMGDASTEYGSLRASLGYPDPIMQIRYVEIGNEDNFGGGLASYNDYRFFAFYNAIKQSYPDMNIIASTIEVSLPDNAVGDYHTYSNPDELVSKFDQFDQNTSEHLTLISEYANVKLNATDERHLPFPNWIGTVAEAVFLIGAESNSHATLGTAYAPLFQNLNSYQWTPNLISFNADSSQTVLSTSCHLIKLFSTHRITTTLPISTTQPLHPSTYIVAGKNEDTGSYILKFAVYDTTSSSPPSSSATTKDVPFIVFFEGVVSAEANVTLTILTAESGEAQNVAGGGEVVRSDVRDLVAGEDGGYRFVVGGLTVGVLEVKT